MFSKKRKYSEVRDSHYSIEKLIEKCTMLEQRVEKLEERIRQLQDEVTSEDVETERTTYTITRRLFM